LDKEHGKVITFRKSNKKPSKLDKKVIKKL
jgi:hypothetical protein